MPSGERLTGTGSCLAVVAAVLSISLRGDGPRGPSPFAGMPSPPPWAAAPPAGWEAPAGIPVPPFGLVQTAPPFPDPWRQPVPGFYFVEPQAPEATDDDNPLGSPVRPRRTVPIVLGPGTVVALRGKYAEPHTRPEWIEATGTAERPVFVRAYDEGAVVTRALQFRGSYLVVEGIEFAFTDAERGDLAVVGPAHYVAIRHCDVHGNLRGGGLAVAGGGDRVSNVVIWANKIHDNGNWRAGYDQDVHGIRVGAHVSSLWVLENELFRNSGDGLQIDAGRADQATTHHVYVGRNVAYENKQMGFWTKQATDVIFSENLSHSHRPSDSSFGAGMGFQYAPERVWFLFNHVHDCDVGIGTASDEGIGTGRSSYFVGNVVHRIHHSDRHYNPATAWSSAAFMLAGGLERHVVHNTIHDVDAGINVPSTSGFVRIVGNIVSLVTERDGNHVFVEEEWVSGQSTMRHNLFQGRLRIQWGGSAVENLRDFADSKGHGAVGRSGEPLLADPAHERFDLLAGSAAVDAGAPDPVYETFRRAYGLTIERDAAGRPRPQGAAWDIGAHEWSGTR